MRDEWIDREIRGFAAAARLIRAGAPSIELPLPGGVVSQDPPPAPPAVRRRPPRRNPRRRRKRSGR